VHAQGEAHDQVRAPQLLEDAQVQPVGLAGAAIRLRERQAREVHAAELVVEIAREGACPLVGARAGRELLVGERPHDVEERGLHVGEAHVSTGARSRVFSRSPPSSVTTTMSSMRRPNASGR
jgi:hypothetical protein